jgi:enoyl-CoA hydratase
MFVNVTTHDGVWLLSVARPPVNAIDLALVNELDERLAEAEGSPACRAAVLTGSSSAFSAGIDVKVVPTYDAATRAEMIRAVNRMVLRIYGLPKPTVAAINGHALGGGLVVALACDFRFAAEGSYQLGLTEVTAGIPFPAAPMIVVRSELDPGTARTLTLSGAVFGPADPPAARFIDRLLPRERLVAEAIQHAAQAASAPAYAAVKRQLRADALKEIARIVERDEDPLLRSWL